MGTVERPWKELSPERMAINDNGTGWQGESIPSIVQKPGSRCWESERCGPLLGAGGQIVKTLTLNTEQTRAAWKLLGRGQVLGVWVSNDEEESWGGRKSNIVQGKCVAWKLETYRGWGVTRPKRPGAV